MVHFCFGSFFRTATVKTWSSDNPPTIPEDFFAPASKTEQFRNSFCLDSCYVRLEKWVESTQSFSSQPPWRTGMICQVPQWQQAFHTLLCQGCLREDSKQSFPLLPPPNFLLLLLLLARPPGKWQNNPGFFAPASETEQFRNSFCLDSCYVRLEKWVESTRSFSSQPPWRTWMTCQVPQW